MYVYSNHSDYVYSIKPGSQYVAGVCDVTSNNQQQQFELSATTISPHCVASQLVAKIDLRSILAVA